MREGRPLWEGEEADRLIEGKCGALMTFSESAAERHAFILPTTFSWSGRAVQRGCRQVALGLFPHKSVSIVRFPMFRSLFSSAQLSLESPQIFRKRRITRSDVGTALGEPFVSEPYVMSLRRARKVRQKTFQSHSESLPNQTKAGDFAF